jgi:hypothetical protein
VVIALLLTILMRWSELRIDPGNETAGTVIGYLISAIPYAMIVTAIGFGIALVVGKLCGKA